MSITAEILAKAVHELTVLKGIPPTIRELGAHLGLSSTSTVHHHVERAVRAGLLERDINSPRSLRTTPKGNNMSWSITIPNTNPSDFPAAVDAAVASYKENLRSSSDADVDPDTEGQIDAAASALKSLVSAGLLGEAPVGASLGGHSNPSYGYTEGNSPNAVILSVTNSSYAVAQGASQPETAGGIDQSGPGEAKATSTTDTPSAEGVAADVAPPQVDSSGTPATDPAPDLNQAAPAGNTDAGASSGMTADPAWTEQPGSPPAPAPEGDASVAATIAGETGVPAPEAGNAGGEVSTPEAPAAS